MIPTALHTIGPFFPEGFCEDGDNDLRRLTRDASPTTRGTPIILSGHVRELGGKPIVNAVLEAWQADAAGRFNHPADPGWQQADPAFLGWGRARTDAEGRYRFLSILPGAYAEPAGRRAPHVDLLVMGLGIMRGLATTVFFPGEDNAADPVLAAVPAERRHLLLARAAGEGGGALLFEFDLLLRGPAEEETPFFAT